MTMNYPEVRFGIFGNLRVNFGNTRVMSKKGISFIYFVEFFTTASLEIDISCLFFIG